MRMQESAARPTPPHRPCQKCGKPTGIQLDGQSICLDCYVDQACCAEMNNRNGIPIDPLEPNAAQVGIDILSIRSSLACSCR